MEKPRNAGPWGRRGGFISRLLAAAAMSGGLEKYQPDRGTFGPFRMPPRPSVPRTGTPRQKRRGEIRRVTEAARRAAQIARGMLRLRPDAFWAVWTAKRTAIRHHRATMDPGRTNPPSGFTTRAATYRRRRDAERKAGRP